MSTPIRCPRGHFLFEALLELSEIVMAQRMPCKACKQDQYVLIANSVVQVRAVGDRRAVVH